MFWVGSYFYSFLSKVAKASFSPIPNFPITLGFESFSWFSFCVKCVYFKPRPKSRIIQELPCFNISTSFVFVKVVRQEHCYKFTNGMKCLPVFKNFLDIKVKFFHDIESFNATYLALGITAAVCYGRALGTTSLSAVKNLIGITNLSNARHRRLEYTACCAQLFLFKFLISTHSLLDSYSMLES